MEDIVLELTDKQILGDNLAKGVLGVVAGVLAKMAVEKGYDAVMTARRLKALTEL